MNIEFTYGVLTIGVVVGILMWWGYWLDDYFYKPSVEKE